MRISVMNAVIAAMTVLHGIIPAAGWLVATKQPVVALDYLEVPPPDCLTDEQCSAE